MYLALPGLKNQLSPESKYGNLLVTHERSVMESAGQDSFGAVHRYHSPLIAWEGASSIVIISVSKDTFPVHLTCRASKMQTEPRFRI